MNIAATGYRAHFDREVLVFTPRAWEGFTAGEREDIFGRLEYLKFGIENGPTDGGFSTSALRRMEQAYRRLRATILGQILHEDEFWGGLWQEQDPTRQHDDPREGMAPWAR